MASRSPEPDRYAPIARRCMARKLRMVNRAVTALYDEALRPFGVKVSQMNVLVAVAVAGPARQNEIAKQLMLEKSTLSRNVERLKNSGWLSVARGQDGRSNELVLTARGRALLDELAPVWRRAQNRVRRLLGDEDVAAIDRMLSALSPTSH